MHIISIILQAISSVLNLYWKYKFTYGSKHPKYWWIMILDALAMSGAMFIQGLPIYGVFELNAAAIGLVAYYKWGDRNTKIIEHMIHAVAIIVATYMYTIIGFSLEYIAVVLFSVFIIMMKNKNKYCWVVLTVGQMIMLVDLWNTGSYIVFVSIAVSMVFNIQGYRSWSRDKIQ